jgi:chaperone modulatory protein CbpM
MDIVEVTGLFADLTQVELTTWIERGWVTPDTAESRVEFREIDLARVRLIHDLRRSLDVGEEAMPVVLSLLDQVYELRSTLKSVLQAMKTQPSDVQLAILANINRDRV